MKPRQRQGLALALENFRGAAELIEVELQNGDAPAAFRTVAQLRSAVAATHDYFFGGARSQHLH